MKRLFALALSAMLWGSLVQAHALQPGYLELRALDGNTWSVFWRKPDVQGQPMALDAVLPDTCAQRRGPEPKFDGEGWSTRWITSCSGGLSGGIISIEGLEETSTDVLVRYELEPKKGQAWRLVPTAPSFEVPVSPGAWEVVKSYTFLGAEHILFGFDHLLFVLALLLLIRDVRLLIGAITAFTVSHSLTLGAAALGWLNIPGPPVEAIIALSIMFVASEIFHRDPDNPRLSERAPWLVSFGFGLIHGLGFGGALSEIGLPQSEIVLALLAFNIGVELGQIVFIAVCLAAWALVRRLIRTDLSLRLETLAVYGIGGWAAFWFVERIAGFV